MHEHFVAHPALYGIVSSPVPPPAPPSPYKRLKDLDELLDLEQVKVSQAKDSYAGTLEQFATLCHELWEKEKAQGSREGKGFRRKLEEAGIDAARAYRAMKKFFPADFPTRKKRKKATSFAANKVANSLPFLRFTRKRPGRSCNTYAPPEVLELAFELTAQQKTEFLRCLKVVGAEQLPQLLLQAMKQAAEAKRTGQQTSVEEQDTPQAPPRKAPRSDRGHSGSLPRKDSRKASTLSNATGAANKSSVFTAGP